MKTIFIKMILLLGVLLAVPFYMLGGDVMPDFMTKLIPNMSPPSVKGISGIGSAVTDEAVTVYEWVDDKGRKHFSSTAPTGQNAKTLHLRPNTNLIQAVKPQVETTPSRPKVTSIGGKMQSPYSPGGAKKLIDDAKNVQEMLNQRFEQQQKLINGR